MTYTDRNIHYSDEILKCFQFNGQFKHQDLRDETFIKISFEDKKLYKDNDKEWFAEITGFMINNGYVYDQEQEHIYRLTERGNLVKELDGHRKYQKHRRREINLLKRQNVINWVLAITALLTALPPIIELGKKNGWWSTQERPIFQIQNQVDVHIDTTHLKGTRETNGLKRTICNQTFIIFLRQSYQ